MPSIEPEFMGPPFTGPPFREPALRLTTTGPEQTKAMGRIIGEFAKPGRRVPFDRSLGRRQNLPHARHCARTWSGRIRAQPHVRVDDPASWPVDPSSRRPLPGGRVRRGPGTWVWMSRYSATASVSLNGPIARPNCSRRTPCGWDLTMATARTTG